MLYWFIILPVILLLAAGLWRRSAGRRRAAGSGSSGSGGGGGGSGQPAAMVVVQGGGGRNLVSTAAYVLDTMIWIVGNLLVIALALAAAKAVGVRLPPAMDAIAAKVLTMLGVGV